MIILGIVLLIVGFVVSIPILWTIGIILVVVGAVFSILGVTGRAIGGPQVLVLTSSTGDRRHPARSTTRASCSGPSRSTTCPVVFRRVGSG
jgi:hypothetical protein